MIDIREASERLAEAARQLEQAERTYGRRMFDDLQTQHDSTLGLLKARDAFKLELANIDSVCVKAFEDGSLEAQRALAERNAKRPKPKPLGI